MLAQPSQRLICTSNCKTVYFFCKYKLAFKRQQALKLFHSHFSSTPLPLKSKHHKPIPSPSPNWLISCLCREFLSQMTRIQNMNKNIYKYTNYCTSKTINKVICEKQGQKDWNKIHVKCYKKRTAQRLIRITAVFRIRFQILVNFSF